MAKTYTQLMEEARQTIPEFTVEEVKNRVERGEHWTLVDVREREEYRAGHLLIPSVVRYACLSCVGILTVWCAVTIPRLPS